MAFKSTTTIYPVVSDASTGFPTTIYPYVMRADDAPKGGYRRNQKVIRTTSASKDAYVVQMNAKIASAGGYDAWLAQLELAQPSAKLAGNAIIGGTADDWRNARASAQRAYDIAQGVNVSGASSEAGLSQLLDEAGDAASSAASSVQSYVQQHPGKAVAWVVGAGVVVYLLARSGRR